MGTTSNKIATLDEAGRWRSRQQGVVVFTNGVFDLLHPGHVDCLEQARALGDALVVGVNSDHSVSQLAKGSDRPFIPAIGRMRMLAALSAVDLVVPFDEPTPHDLIQRLRPEVLCKGGDYTRDTIVGADIIESYGGRVVVLPLTETYSTTHIVETIRAT